MASSGEAGSEAFHRGGCQCGAIRFRIRGELPASYCCHCKACQKQTASAFSQSVVIALDRIELERGEPRQFTVIGASGAEKHCYFCGECGTRMWHQSARRMEQVALRVGTLDENRDIRPQYHLWVSRKLDWVVLDPDVPAYQTQPGLEAPCDQRP